MAREEHDREDLLSEATALVERAELRMPGFADPVVIGFRRDGCGSIYLGAEPVWQFNSRGELRRAHVDGRLLKAERGRLVALERRRTETEVQLVRHELDADETASLLLRLQTAVTELSAALDSGDFELVGQSPVEGNVVARIKSSLAALPRVPRVADAPNAR
jgi:hypothetical protein